MQTRIENKCGILKPLQLDESSHQPFRSAYQKLFQEHDLRELVVELGAIEHINSTTLGMLLVLHREAGNHDVNVVLTQCQPMVLKVLRISNFDSMFKIVALR